MSSMRNADAAKRGSCEKGPTVQFPVRLVQDIVMALLWIQRHREEFTGAEEWIMCPKATMELTGDLVREIWREVGESLDDSVLHSGRVQAKGGVG